MEEMLGDEWKRFNYRLQHPWILSEKTFDVLAKKSGFTNIEVKYYQLYGFSNFIRWLNERRPTGDKKLPFIDEVMDLQFRKKCE